MKKALCTLAIFLMTASYAEAKRIYEYTAMTAPAAADQFLISDASDSNREFSITLSVLNSYLVSDTEYNATSWDGVTTVAASKNAVRDAFEALPSLTIQTTAITTGANNILGSDYGLIADTDGDGLPNKVDLAAAGFVKTDANGVLSGSVVTANGESLITAANYAAMRTLLDLEPGVDYDSATPSTLDLTADASISATQLLANKFISNQGASGEVDITLPAVSYSITRTILITEAQIAEINPPSGEAFDLAGTALDADDCIDSPATVGAKAVFTRMQNASGTWHWSVDTVRGTWVDTGASD